MREKTHIKVKMSKKQSQPNNTSTSNAFISIHNTNTTRTWSRKVANKQIQLPLMVRLMT